MVLKNRRSGVKNAIFMGNPMILAPLQPPVTVAKGKISFSTMTHGGKGYFLGFIGFSHYIYENELTSENMYLPMILTKNSHFNFSFFKVDCQNHKFNLEYLTLS